MTDTPNDGMLFIANRWLPPASGGSLDVIAPANGRKFAIIAAGDARDVDRAVAAARHALEGTWGRMPAVERGRRLQRLALLVERDAEELAALECRDTGRPRAHGVADIAALARYFEYYGAAADKVHGDTIPYLDGYIVTTTHEPHGVTAHIIPWNYPAQMFGRTIAPALAMGNAAVVKPAEDACLTVLRIADLIVEAGFSEGAVNIVPGRGEEAGAALAGHPGVDFISFTGSPEVGVLIQSEAARNHIGCTLELGGKSPHVVFDDAAIDDAIPAIVRGIVQNAGQTCSAGSRVLVARNCYDAVVARLAAEFEVLVAGPPGEECDLGPVVNAVQKGRIERYMAAASADGIPLIASGRISDRADPDGFFVPPTLWGPVPEYHPLAREEVFGPLLSVLTFGDEADAIRLANATPYGLMAAIWTRDLGRGLRVARAIRAGQIYVNGFAAGGGIELPFGGMKKSGHGREKGFAALHDYSVLKTTIIKHG